MKYSVIYAYHEWSSVYIMAVSFSAFSLIIFWIISVYHSMSVKTIQIPEIYRFRGIFVFWHFKNMNDFCILKIFLFYAFRSPKILWMKAKKQDHQWLFAQLISNLVQNLPVDVKIIYESQWMKKKLTRVVKMKAILLMIGIFLILIISFLIIFLMTADRAGNAEALLPENSIEFAGVDKESVYNQMFI